MLQDESFMHDFNAGNDCSLYWSCDDGTATLQRCGDGFLFQPLKGQCYPEDLVECEKK